MMNNIINILKENNKLYGYIVTKSHKKSSELFYVFKNLETIRRTNTTQIDVTIYVEHDQMLGNATFPVYNSDTKEDILAKIDEAYNNCLLVSNKPYKLVEKEEANFDSESNFKDYSLNTLAKKISDAVFSVEYYDSVINATEIFVNELELEIINSNGLHKKEKSYSAMVEAIPTYNGSEESVELYEQYNFNQFDEVKIKEEILTNLKLVKARYEAIKPDFEIECPIILHPEEIESLMYNLSSELSYYKVYNKSNAYKIGDFIVEDAIGDKINLELKAKQNGVLASKSFEITGLSLTDTKVISDNKVINYYGDNRFGQYLDIKKPTGNLGCLVLGFGSKSNQELKVGKYLDCMSFSGIQIDISNDYIGGEVRLALYHDGQKEIPVTGISISGRLSDLLKNMTLSNEEGYSKNYYGPSILKATNIKII